jgi:tetratricopeptide (TPR) repeat protein
MRHNFGMRFLWVIFLAACGSSVTHAPSVPRAPTRDLAAAKQSAPHADARDATAKDPRVVDLDILRITAGDGAGDVATGDLFRQANEAAHAGQTEHAISLYRRIVADFPESKYAPTSLFDIAALYDGRGDVTATITALRELVKSYPGSRESVEGHLYIAAVQAEHQQFADAVTTLDEALARPSLTYADRIEAFARKGYSLFELHRDAEADTALTAAISEWKQAPPIEDVYYAAMAHYYRGELAHRAFLDAPVRLPDDQLLTDLDHKRVLAVQAYDRWKETLGFRHVYWATAAGYQMSQIFVELWSATVKAPYPAHVAATARGTYNAEVHARSREHLEKALEGHRMNVELAKAFGVDTAWSRGSAQRAAQVMELLGKDQAGELVTPETAEPIAATR